MDGGEAAAPAHELLLMRATGIYCWPKPTMGRTIFGAHTGALLLTNQRLVFMSSGGTDAWSKMAWGALGLGPDAVANATMAVDLGRTLVGWIGSRFGERELGRPIGIGSAARLADGSVCVPLTELSDYRFVRRRFSTFLSIACAAPGGGRPLAFSFSTNVALPGGEQWETAIRAAREALLTDPA